jgi:DUF4097 and DUF4098 domain-containing protein YvlB
MSEERMRILEMVREGKITAEEAVRLLEALKGSSAESAGPAGERQRRSEDPIGGIVDAVTEAFVGRGWRGFGRGWGGNWGNWGNWEGHGHGGSLRGQERRQRREAEGWQIGTYSEGDRGGFEFPEGAKLRIESEAGAIEARAVDGPARLDLEGDDFFNFATYVARKGDELIVAAYRTDHHARMPRLVVGVPRHVSRLSVETAGGSVEASGFACPTNVKTAGGSIRIRSHGQGRLELRTAGGGIDVEGNPEVLDAKTAGGSIRLKGQTNSFEAKTAGGSINLDGVRLTSGAHRAKTAGGSVNLRLTPDSSVAIEAATGAGSINVNLPGAQGQLSGSRIAPRYHGTFNGSGATLELRTVGGSINLSLTEQPATVAA